MPRRRDALGRFVGTKGAPPGSRPVAEPTGTRPSRDLVAELHASWKRHGAATVDELRVTRPQDYVRMVATLTKVAGSERAALEAMSLKEIADEIRAIRKGLAASRVDPLE
jgi:hypothetical protein